MEKGDNIGSKERYNETTGALERRLMIKELEQGLPVRRTNKWRCVCGNHSRGKKSLFFHSNKMRYSIRLLRRWRLNGKDL